MFSDTNSLTQINLANWDNDINDENEDKDIFKGLGTTKFKNIGFNDND